MKRFWVLFILMAALLLSSCGQKSSRVYTATLQGEDYTVDTVKQTITNNGQTYLYKINGSIYEITYPDHSTYRWTREGSVGYGDGSSGYDAKKYVPGDTLVQTLSASGSSSGAERAVPKNLFVSILLLAVGVLDLAAPRCAWFLSYGWRYKNAEPSNAVLVLGRIAGVIVILIALALLLA